MKLTTTAKKFSAARFDADYIVRSDDDEVITVRNRPVSTVVECMHRAYTLHNHKTRRKLSSVDGLASWTGSESIEEYASILRDGWADALDGVEGLEGAMDDAASALVFQRDVCGAFPVVPAHIAGAPNSMLRPTIAPVDRTRSVTLVLDGSFASHTKAETVVEYAHSVMRLIAWLQTQQIEVAVELVCAVKWNAKRYVYTTTVREMGTVSAPERIASMLHPSWLRRAWFATVEVEHYDCTLPGSEMARSSFGSSSSLSPGEVSRLYPETESVILLPKVGKGDPRAAVENALNIKLRSSR